MRDSEAPLPADSSRGSSPGSSLGGDGVLLTRTANEFEAAVIVAMLADQGIDALAAPASSAPFGAALRGELPTTPVLVRGDDFAAARDALRRMRDGTIPDDRFDEIESDPADDGPPRLRARPGRSMLASAPLLAVIGWAVAVSIVLLAIVAAILAVVI